MLEAESWEFKLQRASGARSRCNGPLLACIRQKVGRSVGIDRCLIDDYEHAIISACLLWGRGNIYYFHYILLIVGILKLSSSAAKG
jgi:hypothetical protein